MIAFLRGKAVNCGGDFVVIDVGGVGYRVYVPTPVAGTVAGKEEEITLYTYMNVREDAMQLFGFLNESDLELFELLLQVSGVGPRMALAVLSSMPGQSFVQAVTQEQADLLTKIPGVGKKTAQRIIIELKDKLIKLGNTGAVAPSVNMSVMPDAAGDALEALITLGYNPVEAKRAIGKLLAARSGNIVTEEIVRVALKELARF